MAFELVDPPQTAPPQRTRWWQRIHWWQRISRRCQTRRWQRARRRQAVCSGGSHRAAAYPQPNRAALTSASRYPWLEADASGGFSSLGVVIALSLVITLVFTSAQIYWLNSRSGDVQFAADAGALAAENVVAEFYVIARVADAVVLSMSLFGGMVLGVSIVVSSIPSAQSAGEKIAEFARDVFSTRDRLVSSLEPALNSLMKVLPWLAIANAAATANANAPTHSNYLALAVLVPFSDEPLTHPDNPALDDQATQIEGDDQEIVAATEAAEAARNAQQAAQLAGWLADCGSTGRCLYERAAQLAGLHNPPACALEDWSFAQALERARRYYILREQQDAPLKSTALEQTHYAVRQMFYHYTQDLLASAHVTELPDGSVDIYFPDLPVSVEDFCNTSMYGLENFPADALGTLHGTRECPDFQAAPSSQLGSIRQLVNGVYSSCPLCDMNLNSVAKTWSMTSITDTGFEYWYHQVATAARDYQSAADRYRQQSQQAQNQTQTALDDFDRALELISTQRFDPHPPGRNGCICLVLDAGELVLPQGLQTTLIANSPTPTLRVAISAAALARDVNEEGNILADFLEGLKAAASSSVESSVWGALDAVLNIWGSALLFYETGIDGLCQGVGDLIRLTSGGGSSELAEWAESAIRDSLRGLGLQAVDLRAPKPLLVNSFHVSQAAPEATISQIVNPIKTFYASLPGTAGGTFGDFIFDGISSEVESYANTLSTDGLTLFTFSLGEAPLDFEIPVRVQLPAAVTESGADYLRNRLQELQNALRDGETIDVWE